MPAPSVTRVRENRENCLSDSTLVCLVSSHAFCGWSIAWWCSAVWRWVDLGWGGEERRRGRYEKTEKTASLILHSFVWLVHIRFVGEALLGDVVQSEDGLIWGGGGERGEGDTIPLGHIQTTMIQRKEMFYLTTLNTLYLQLYGVRHIVKDHSDSERGNPQPPRGALAGTTGPHSDHSDSKEWRIFLI